MVARAVARPAEDGVVPDPSQVLGDPETDTVLSLALRRAAAKSTTARRP